MPSFENIVLNLTGRILHEEDFPFRKTKEELALRIRSDSVPRIKELWSLQFAEVGFDSDGDIQVETDKGTLFVGRDAVVASTWGKSLGSIGDGRDLQVLADVLDGLLKSRAALHALQFAVRFFFTLRFRRPFSPLELLEDVCPVRASKLLWKVEPSAVRSVRWTVDTRDGVFSDTVEFSVGPTRVDVRQSRESDADKFLSFSEFALAAHVPAMLERLRPSIDPLIADPSNLEVGSFQQ
jgi:hypothetical protein